MLVPAAVRARDRGAAAVIHDGPTALRIVRLVDVLPGEHVPVLGAAGGMGILLVQLLLARGAQVIGAARGQAKMDAVRHVLPLFLRPGAWWLEEVFGVLAGKEPGDPCWRSVLGYRVDLEGCGVLDSAASISAAVARARRSRRSRAATSGWVRVRRTAGLVLQAPPPYTRYSLIYSLKTHSSHCHQFPGPPVLAGWNVSGPL